MKWNKVHIMLYSISFNKRNSNNTIDGISFCYPHNRSGIRTKWRRKNSTDLYTSLQQASPS